VSGEEKFLNLEQGQDNGPSRSMAQRCPGTDYGPGGGRAAFGK